MCIAYYQGAYKTGCAALGIVKLSCCLPLVCLKGLGWHSGQGAAPLVGWSRDRFPVVSLGILSMVPPTESCALRSTQPLKVSTRDFSWGKGGRCVWLTTYHPCSAEESRKSGALTYPEPLGPPRPVAGDLYFTLPLVWSRWNCSTPTTPVVDSRKAWQYPRLHIHFYKLLMMGGKTARNI